MYGRVTEHTFYSFSPKCPAKAAYCVREARSTLQWVPGMNHEVLFARLLFQVPQPNHRVQPQAQARGTFGALALERLRLLAAEKLFGVFERILDRPAVRITFYNLGWGHSQIGSKKEIVFFFAFRIPADNQQYRLLRNSVPQQNYRVNQSDSAFASFADFYLLPMVNTFGQFLRTENSLAFFARTAAEFLLGGNWQIVEFGVALYPRNNGGVQKFLSSQGGVKTICNHSKQPFRMPFDDFFDHLLGQLDQSRLFFAVQSHIDGQAQRFPTPGRLNLQSQHHQVQAPSGNVFGGARTDCISPPARSIDLFATVVKQGVVQSQGNGSGSIECFDQYLCQDPPESSHAPTSIGKETVKGVVSVSSLGIGERQDSGYCPPDGAQNPSVEQLNKDFSAGNRKIRQKVQDKGRPCRYTVYRIHTNLRVVTVSLQSSEGWYVFVYDSWPLAA